MKRFFPATFALLMASAALASGVQADLTKGKEIAEGICAACHNVDGNSGISIYPKIAGQHVEYLNQQVIDIRDGKRAWGMAAAMQPMIMDLSDEDIHNVNAYFSQQLALPGESDPSGNMELGKQIYRGGLSAEGEPACMSCHGPNGAGIPAGSVAKDGINGFPRISGQHKDYIVAQMQAFRDGTRTHVMMSPIAHRLTDEQVDAVSNYIQGLH